MIKDQEAFVGIERGSVSLRGLIAFFQTEKLVDKKVARTVKLYFTDESGQKISNEQSILADRISEKASERTFKASFNLKSSNYNKSDKYYLVLEDPDEPIKKIYDKISFNISLGIVNEFDFLWVPGDTAFFDRMHYYIPGWEVPKMRPEFLTNEYGFIVDYLAEFFREMRKRSFSDALDKYFKLGNNLNQRDVIAVRKTVSGLVKLLYPQSQLVVLGSMSLGGTINKVEELANTLQVCFDTGAKKILLPMASAVDIATVPPELFAKFQMSFYQSPEDAVFKALGVE